MLILARDVFNVKEVAIYLHISEAFVRKLIRSSGIPFFRIGKKIMFDKQDIENWLKENRNKGE